MTKNPEKSRIFEIKGVLLIALASLLFLSMLDFNIGFLGNSIRKIMYYTLGQGSLFFVVLLFTLGLRYIYCDIKNIYNLKFIAIIALSFNILILFHNFIAPLNSELLPEYLRSGGGIISAVILFASRKFLGILGSWVVFITTFICLSIAIFKLSIKNTTLVVQKNISNVADSLQEAKSQMKKRSFFNYENILGKKNTNNIEKKDSTKLLIDSIEENENKEQTLSIESFEEVKKDDIEVNTQKSVFTYESIDEDYNTYKLPPVSLLNRPKKTNDKANKQSVLTQAAILEQTLVDFKVNAKIVNIVSGPSVIRFEIEPAPGVKVNKIASLADDLTLRLAVSGIRIETSIPGKSAMGIEVPKAQSSSVNFYDVVSSQEFQSSKNYIPVALGKNITGETIVADISKMPHILIAGATGSGKSVCINTIINSILFKASPHEVKFIMIDPKVVELSTYNGIPHLLTPVVTNPKKAASSLFWAVEEMERRYSLFAESGVRDINRYNTIVEEKNSLPYIVIIIDELADLMLVAPSDVEDAICRLAQKARAAGLHLILATQRPSVDVITGIIKANIPSRIAFSVSSQIDSRTILDSSGAEKLLGKGDMLYAPVGVNKPERIQGAFISDNEIENIVNHIKKQMIPVEYTESVTEHSLPSEKKNTNDQKTDVGEYDELMGEALDIIMQTTQASTSMLQRRLRIGYTRAARIIDIMEEHGIIGPPTGTSKPRDIIVSYEDACDRLGL